MWALNDTREFRENDVATVLHERDRRLAGQRPAADLVILCKEEQLVTAVLAGGAPAALQSPVAALSETLGDLSARMRSVAWGESPAEKNLTADEYATVGSPFTHLVSGVDLRSAMAPLSYLSVCCNRQQKLDGCASGKQKNYRVVKSVYCAYNDFFRLDFRIVVLLRSTKRCQSVLIFSRDENGSRLSLEDFDQADFWETLELAGLLRNARHMSSECPEYLRVYPQVVVQGGRHRLAELLVRYGPHARLGGPEAALFLRAALCSPAFAASEIARRTLAELGSMSPRAAAVAAHLELLTSASVKLAMGSIVLGATRHCEAKDTVPLHMLLWQARVLLTWSVDWRKTPWAFSDDSLWLETLLVLTHHHNHRRNQPEDKKLSQVDCDSERALRELAWQAAKLATEAEPRERACWIALATCHALDGDVAATLRALNMAVEFWDSPLTENSAVRDTKERTAARAPTATVPAVRGLGFFSHLLWNPYDPKMFKSFGGPLRFRNPLQAQHRKPCAATLADKFYMNYLPAGVARMTSSFDGGDSADLHRESSGIFKTPYQEELGFGPDFGLSVQCDEGSEVKESAAAAFVGEENPGGEVPECDLLPSFERYRDFFLVLGLLVKQRGLPADAGRQFSATGPRGRVAALLAEWSRAAALSNDPPAAVASATLEAAQYWRKMVNVRLSVGKICEAEAAARRMLVRCYANLEVEFLGRVYLLCGFEREFLAVMGWGCWSIDSVLSSHSDDELAWLPAYALQLLTLFVVRTGRKAARQCWLEQVPRKFRHPLVERFLLQEEEREEGVAPR